MVAARDRTALPPTVMLVDLDRHVGTPLALLLCCSVSACSSGHGTRDRLANRTPLDAPDSEPPRDSGPRASAIEHPRSPAADSPGPATPPGQSRSPAPASPAPASPEPAPAVAATNASPDPRDPAGAVAWLAALCEHAKGGDHTWVGARVRLPLRGIHGINDSDADPFVHPNEDTAVEDFQHTAYCKMLPPPGTPLREVQRTDSVVAGIVDFGELPHRIEIDLTADPPVLTTLDAQVPRGPIPAKAKNKVRPYEIGAPPQPLVDKEPAGSEALRRAVIRALRKDRRCLDAYVRRNTSVVRFQVFAEAMGDGTPGVRVEPFQLVRASVLACLRAQLPARVKWTKPIPTNAIIEVLIPVSADELPEGAPTVTLGGVPG